jgi:hypothetical protein
VSAPLFVSTVIFLGNLALHELSHLVAARSLGIPARFHLGTRLHNLVIQTNVTGLWAVPRRQRYRVYAAGMLWDLIPMSLAVLLLAYAAPSGIIAALLPVVILMIFFGILTQFQFYMRTDVYFILLDLLRCYDLFEDGMRYVRHRVRRLSGRLMREPTAELADPLMQVAPHERPKVRLYAWLVVVGSTITLAVFFIYGVPIIVQLFVQAAQSLSTGIVTGNLWLVVDGGATLLIEGSLQALFVFAFVRNRRHWFVALKQRLARKPLAVRDEPG